MGTYIHWTTSEVALCMQNYENHLTAKANARALNLKFHGGKEVRTWQSVGHVISKLSKVKPKPTRAKHLHLHLSEALYWQMRKRSANLGLQMTSYITMLIAKDLQDELSQTDHARGQG